MQCTSTFFPLGVSVSQVISFQAHFYRMLTSDSLWGLHRKVDTTKSRFLIESLILTSCWKRVLFIHFDHRAALLPTKQMANAWCAVPPMGEQPQICLPILFLFLWGVRSHRSVSPLTIKPYRDVSHLLLFVSEVISIAK